MFKAKINLFAVKIIIIVINKSGPSIKAVDANNEIKFLTKYN